MGCQSQSRQRLLASARELTFRTVAGEGVGFVDNRSSTCYVRGLWQRQRCYVCGQWRVVGGSEGVDGVWYTADMATGAARASTDSSIQRRWLP